MQISESDRNSFMFNLFSRSREAASLKSLEFCSELYLLDTPFVYCDGTSNLSHAIQYEKENIGYKVEGFSNDCAQMLAEKYSTALVAKKSEITQGFFFISIELIQYENSASVYIELEQIYVGKAFRATKCWMDLTIGVVKFFSLLIEGIFLKCQNYQKLDVIIIADLASSGGERIANAIKAEMEDLLENLAFNYPHRAHVIGEVVSEVGY